MPFHSCKDITKLPWENTEYLIILQKIQTCLTPWKLNTSRYFSRFCYYDLFSILISLYSFSLSSSLFPSSFFTTTVLTSTYLMPFSWANGIRVSWKGKVEDSSSRSSSRILYKIFFYSPKLLYIKISTKVYRECLNTCLSCCFIRTTDHSSSFKSSFHVFTFIRFAQFLVISNKTAELFLTLVAIGVNLTEYLEMIFIIRISYLIYLAVRNF